MGWSNDISASIFLCDFLFPFDPPAAEASEKDT